jgi:hypothetical protein
MHLSSASPGVDPRGTQGILLRGRNKTLTNCPRGTGEIKFYDKNHVTAPYPRGTKKQTYSNVPITETIMYYITGELDTKYSRKVNNNCPK